MVNWLCHALLFSHFQILQSTALTQVADKEDLSRNHYFSVVASMIDASLGNRDDFVLSPSVGRRARSSHTKLISSQINQNFVPSQYLVVDWDGKIMIDSSDESKKHIAVAISGTPDYESRKLFGVRKLDPVLVQIRHCRETKVWFI